MKMTTPLRSAVALLLALAGASPCSAQVVRGITRDAATRTQLREATVQLLDSVGRAIAEQHTDSCGGFEFQVRGGRIVHVKVTLFGYDEVTTPPFRVGRDTAIALDLVPSALQVDPIRVEAASRSPRLAQAGFYARRERGFGSFVTRAQIDSTRAIVLTDILRTIPGVTIIRAGLGAESIDVLMPGARTRLFRESETRGQPPNRTCYPSVAIDGVVVRRGGQDDEAGAWVHLVPPNDVEAVEVYTSAAGLPPQMSGSVSPCGSILIWMRRG